MTQQSGQQCTLYGTHSTTQHTLSTVHTEHWSQSGVSTGLSRDSAVWSLDSNAHCTSSTTQHSTLEVGTTPLLLACQDCQEVIATIFTDRVLIALNLRVRIGLLPKHQCITSRTLPHCSVLHATEKQNMHPNLSMAFIQAYPTPADECLKKCAE